MFINGLFLLVLTCLSLEVSSHYHNLKKHSDLRQHGIDCDLKKEDDKKVSDAHLIPHDHVHSYKIYSPKRSLHKVRRSIDQRKRFIFGHNHNFLDRLYLRANAGPFINSKTGLIQNRNLINAEPFVSANKPVKNYIHVHNRLLQPYSVRNSDRQNPWEDILLRVENTLENIRKIQEETSRNLASRLPLENSTNVNTLNRKEENNLRQPEKMHSSASSFEPQQTSTTTFKPYTIDWNAKSGSHSFPTFPPVMFNRLYTEDMFIQNSANNGGISGVSSNFNKRRTVKSPSDNKFGIKNIFKKVHQHKHLGKPHHHHINKLFHLHRCHDELGISHHHRSNHPSLCQHSSSGVNVLDEPETVASDVPDIKNEFQSDTLRRLDSVLSPSVDSIQPNTTNIPVSKLLSDHIHINHKVETSTHTIQPLNTSSITSNKKTQNKTVNNEKILCKDGGSVEIPVLNINLPCGDLSSSGGHPDDYYKREFAASMTDALKDYIEEEKEKINEENHDIDIRLGRTKRSLKGYKKPEKIIYNSSNENKINGKALKVYRERNVSVFGEIMDMPKDLSKNESADYFDLSMLSEYFLEAVESLDESSLVEVLKALKEDYLSKSPGDQVVVDEVYEKLVTSLLDYKRAAGNWTERRRRESPSKAKEGTAAVLELLAETDKFLESEMQDDPFAADYSGEYNDKDHEPEANDNPSFLELVSLADKHKSNIKS